MHVYNLQKCGRAGVLAAHTTQQKGSDGQCSEADLAANVWEATVRDLCGAWPSLRQLLLAGAVQRMAEPRLRGASLHLRSQGFERPCQAHLHTARSKTTTELQFRVCLLPNQQLALSLS